jgi:hypothetical protein
MLQSPLAYSVTWSEQISAFWQIRISLLTSVLLLSIGCVADELKSPE